MCHFQIVVMSASLSHVVSLTLNLVPATDGFEAGSKCLSVSSPIGLHNRVI